LSFLRPLDLSASAAAPRSAASKGTPKHVHVFLASTQQKAPHETDSWSEEAEGLVSEALAGHCNDFTSIELISLQKIDGSNVSKLSFRFEVGGDFAIDHEGFCQTLEEQANELFRVSKVQVSFSQLLSKIFFGFH
jgi:hypothetical protein